MTVRGVLCLLLIFAIAETKAFNTPSLRYVRLSHVSMAKDKVSVPYPGYGKGKRGDPLKKKKELKPIPDGYVLDEETNNARARPSELAARDEENASKEGVHRIVKLSTEERINKVLARAGVASRRGAETYVLDGRVSVNGNIVTELGHKVDTLKDVVLVDGKKIALPDAKSTFWLAVNKPRNVLSTMNDEKDKDRQTLSSLVHKAKELRLVPVGRMERDSTGLIILTNDIGWIHPLTHASFGGKIRRRRYEVVLEGFPTQAALDLLDNKEEGVKGRELKALKAVSHQQIDNRQMGTPTGSGYGPGTGPGGYTASQGASISTSSSPALPAVTLPQMKYEVIDYDRRAGLTLLDLSMDEICPQQLQRVCDDILQCRLLSTKRSEFGPIKLGGLRRGEWRELSAGDVEKLKSSVERADSTGSSSADKGGRDGHGKSWSKKGVYKMKKPGAGYAARTLSREDDPTRIPYMNK